MKKFQCMPIAFAIPLVFLLMVFVWLLLMVWVNQPDMVPLSIGYVSICVFLVFATSIPAARRVEIFSDKIVCKGLLPSQTYEIRYDDCNVGLDYGLASGRKIWWIYICYGPPPQYRSALSPNRMNAEKFRPGFIKLHYRKDLCDALVQVLPKKQCEMLTSAMKCKTW